MSKCIIGDHRYSGLTYKVPKEIRTPQNSRRSCCGIHRKQISELRKQYGKYCTITYEKDKKNYQLFAKSFEKQVLICGDKNQYGAMDDMKSTFKNLMYDYCVTKSFVDADGLVLFFQSIPLEQRKCVECLILYYHGDYVSVIGSKTILSIKDIIVHIIEYFPKLKLLIVSCCYTMIDNGILRSCTNLPFFIMGYKDIVNSTDFDQMLVRESFQTERKITEFSPERCRSMMEDMSKKFGAMITCVLPGGEPVVVQSKKIYYVGPRERR